MYGSEKWSLFCFSPCGWTRVEMNRSLLLAVCLLGCLWIVQAQSPEEEEEDVAENLRLCALPFNVSTNASEYYRNLSQLSKSFCKDYSTDCYSYYGTVSMDSDSVSHTGASSTIRVAVNPNATAGLDEFDYIFCVSYNSSTTFELVACASNYGEEFEVQHYWAKNGLAEMRVGVFSKYSHREPLGCNATETIVAGNFGLKIGMELFDDQHSDSNTSSSPPSSSSSSYPHSTPSSITNSTNNTYVTGNLTFVPQTEITLGDHQPEYFYHYYYVYDYGDNSSVEEQSKFNSTHLYSRPGNYLYTVEGFVVYKKDLSRAYYAMHRGSVTILEPVSNVSVRFNNNNSIIADTKVYLHICANGSFPISVCWTVQRVNSSNSSVPLTSSHYKCPSSSSSSSPSSSSSSSSSGDHINVCHTITDDSPCPSYDMSFTERGRYDMTVAFSNKVSCISVNYTFQVVAASKPPIVATTTSVGVVVAIVLAVVVVLIILAVGGYLPYRRYRNHMIETADFKFIDLTEKKPSAWTRFRMKFSRLIYPRKNTDKIGLVNLIDDPHRATNRSSSSPSSSSSLASSNSNSNYNAI